MPGWTVSRMSAPHTCFGYNRILYLLILCAIEFCASCATSKFIRIAYTHACTMYRQRRRRRKRVYRRHIGGIGSKSSSSSSSSNVLLACGGGATLFLYYCCCGGGGLLSAYTQAHTYMSAVLVYSTHMYVCATVHTSLG